MTSQARHPDAFDCGVRVVSGQVSREGTRWSFRLSSVDPLVIDGVITLQHGSKATLGLVGAALSDEPRSGAVRPGHVVVAAIERDTGAHLQISVELGHLDRFGIEAAL